MTLPVYDSWAFTTTERGDLETLARRLTARDLSAASRPLALDAGSVTGDVDGRVAPLLGALHPVDAIEAWAPTAADAAAITLTGELERSGAAPVVGLPVYGSTASGSTDVTAGWSRRLNLDPRRRAAAGLGAAMVRDHQEALVDEAWRQAGDIDRAKREHQGARLADLAASRLRSRMIEPLTAASALVTMAPALARTAAAPGTTQRALVAASAVPPAMLDSPLRRIAATKLPRAARTAGQGIRTAIAVQNAQVLFPGGPPPAPVSTVTLGALQAELGTTPVNTGIVPPGVVTPTAPGPIVHGGGHVLHGGPGLHADLAPGTGAHGHAPRRCRRRLRCAGRPVAGPDRGRRRRGGAHRPDDHCHPVGDGQPAPADDRGRRLPGVHRHRACSRSAWTPPPPTPDPATATSRARARLVVTGGIVFDLPVGMRTTPRFTQPLAAWLEPGLLLAGVDLPPDTAGLLEVNGAFVEALLVGANHELARELLWRGVPLDRRATLLTQFFEAEGTTPPAGLQPVAEWTAADDLGSHVSFGEQVVLILRSHLVSHLDQTTIFLAPAVADGEFRKPGTEQLMPSFRGTAGLDTAYFGFPIDEASLRAGLGWYLVIQELVGAVRFGLDEEATTPMRTWNDLGWTAVGRGARLRRRDAGPDAADHHRRVGVGCRRRPHGRDLHAAPGARLDPHLAAPAGRWLMAAPYTELDAALPIVMLPVRVETRWFAVNADLVELRVRIFPSRLHTYVDRPGIDPIERDEAIAYWRIRRADGDDALTTEAAWNRLVQLFGEVRAQYLRRLLDTRRGDVVPRRADRRPERRRRAVGRGHRAADAVLHRRLRRRPAGVPLRGHGDPGRGGRRPGRRRRGHRLADRLRRGRGDRPRHPPADDPADRRDAHPPRRLRRARGRRRGDERRCARTAAHRSRPARRRGPARTRDADEQHAGGADPGGPCCGGRPAGASKRAGPSGHRTGGRDGRRRAAATTTSSRRSRRCTRPCGR